MTDDNVVNSPSDPVGRAILQITNDLTRIATQVGKFVDMQKQINHKVDRELAHIQIILGAQRNDQD